MNHPPIKRLAAVVLTAFLLSPAARADNPVTGASLFASNCTGCHGTSPLTSNTSKIYFGRNARAVIDNAISNNREMNSLRSSFPTNGAQIADVAAYLGNSPSTLTFASTSVGTTAAATQTVTVAASLKGSSYAISGLSVTTNGDFARSGGTCGTAVASGTSCTVIVSFAPTAAGARTGTLSIAHDNTLTPVVIALSGTGSGSAAAPVATISPISLSFSATAIGATSAAQNVSISNTGSAPLTLSTLTLSSTADFTIAGGTCAAGGSVAAGSSCTVSLAFRPAPGSAGTRNATLAIAYNAAGSPGSVSVSGSATAAAAPVAGLTASLSFGSVSVGTTSAAQTATLSNTGTTALTICTLSTGSTEFAITGGSCAAGGSVAAAASCTISVAFTPSAAGSRSAGLVVTHNANGAQSSSSLSGTGVALTPAINLSPTALGFSQTLNTTSAAQSITVSNTGNATLVLGALTLTGAQASEYQLNPSGTCAAGTSIAPNASCSVSVIFSPTAIGARSASLSITHNASGSPSSVALNGSGTATAQPSISLNASTLTFAAQTVGSASGAQTVIVSNSGAAALTLGTITLTGTAAGDFGQAGSCSANTALAVGSTCTLSMVFTPGATGTRTATLTLASNASNGAAVLSLSGTGAAAAAPAVEFAPGALAFGNQTVASTSTVRTATLKNSGSGALAVTSISASSGFGVTHDCGSRVAAGGSCVLSVSFTPSAVGALTGSVTVASNAAGSPHALGVSGTGVTSSPVLAWVPATTALAFGDLAVGASPSTQTLTLNNQGPGAVTLQHLTLAGAQASDFSLGGAGSCAVNAALAQGTSCSVAVVFQPGAVGSRNAVLQLVSSGTNPPDVALAGNGTAMAQASIAVVPSAITWSLPAGTGSAEPQTLTLQNPGNAVLRVTGVRIVSGGFTLAAASAGCAAVPFDLLPGQTCGIAVAWSGSATDTDTGSLEIDSGASAAPTAVALQIARAAPAVTMSNVGGGGCSLARGDTLADPTLWLLALLAIGVLWHRRARP